MYRRSNNTVSEDCKRHSANAILTATHTIMKLKVAQEGQKDPESLYYEMDDSQVLQKLGLQTHCIQQTASSAEHRDGSCLNSKRKDLTITDQINQQKIAL